MNIPSELAKAKRLIAAQQLNEAKAVLRDVLDQDKRNAEAWYLVSQAVAEPRAKAEALRRVLLTDPNHAPAKKEFEAMDGLVILKPPSLNKPTTSVPVSKLPKRSMPWIPLLIGGLVLFAVGIGVGIGLASPGSASGTPTLPARAVAVAISATPERSTTSQESPTVQARLTASPSGTPTLSVNSAGDSGDAVVLTATALQQGIGATGTGLAQAANTTTQIAALTQTATQQGALGATVAAQQTLVAASNALHGTLIMSGTPIPGVVSDKIQYAASSNHLVQVIAPDGKHMVYTKMQQQAIFIANLDGSAEQPITGFGTNTEPDDFTWSPDGQWLTATSTFDGKVYLVSPTDRIAHLIPLPNITATQPGTVHPPIAWSPNRQHLAVFGTTTSISRAADTQTNVYIVDVTHLDAPPLRVPSASAFWFGNDQQLRFIQYNFSKAVGQNQDQMTLLEIDLVTQTQRTLWTIQVPTQTQATTFIVAPDGKHLAYIGYPPSGNAQLLLLNLDGHMMKVLTDLSLEAISFQWSPDGQFLLVTNYNSFPGDNITVKKWVQVDDLSVHPILPNDLGRSGSIWSPDSHTLLVCQVTQATLYSVTAGQTWLVPLAANSQPIKLFNQVVCPSLWVP